MTPGQSLVEILFFTDKRKGLCTAPTCPLHWGEKQAWVTV